MDLPEFYQLIIDHISSPAQTHAHKCMEFIIHCYNVNHTFCISKLFFKKKTHPEDTMLHAYISYYPIKSSSDAVLFQDLISDSSVPNVVNAMFDILWTYQLCNECYYLIPSNQSSICKHCQPSKLFWEYGLSRGYVEYIPQCMICLDPVYSSKLDCGHYVHRTCFIQMNPKDQYENNLEIKCPCCRQSITIRDKSNYFLMDDD